MVPSTVCNAADRAYRIFIVADASAGREDEVHDFLVERIFPRQATIVTVAELDRLFASAEEGSRDDTR